MSDKAFLVDTSKCSGCRACQVACKQWNGLPGEKTTFFGGTEYTNPARLSAKTWNHVVFSTLDRSNPERPEWTIMHKKCYHCNEANCIAVCPEKAISKVNGWTIIDQKKCIGCGACESECTYNVPQVAAKTHVNDLGVTMIQKDKSHKCNACTQNERDIPACVGTCPTGALQFGSRLEMIKLADERVAKIKKDFPNANVYGKNEYGGLKVITVLKVKPAKMDLPTGAKAKQIKVTKVDAVNDVYSLFSMATFGVPALKRLAYKAAKSFTKNA